MGNHLLLNKTANKEISSPSWDSSRVEQFLGCKVSLYNWHLLSRPHNICFDSVNYSERQVNKNCSWENKQGDLKHDEGISLDFQKIFPLDYDQL